jgi:hypothetical protein
MGIREFDQLKYEYSAHAQILIKGLVHVRLLKQDFHNAANKISRLYLSHSGLLAVFAVYLANLQPVYK